MTEYFDSFEYLTKEAHSIASTLNQRINQELTYIVDNEPLTLKQIQQNFKKDHQELKDLVNELTSLTKRIKNKLPDEQTR